MITLKIDGNKILQVEQGQTIVYAVCDQPEKAIALMMRGWQLNEQRHYTASARKFYEVEQLPGFAWGTDRLA